MDRRLGPAAGKGHIHMCENHPELPRYATLSDFPLTVVTRDPMKGGNEGGRAAVGELGLIIFFCIGMHFHSLMPLRGPHYVCVPRAVAAASTRRFLITCICIRYEPSAGKARVGASMFTE
jgi:hypothetical protein